MNGTDSRTLVRFHTPAEAAANKLVSPALTALLPPMGAFFLGLATALLILVNAGPWPHAVTAFLAWLILGCAIAGLRLLGLFDLLTWLVQFRQAQTVVVSADVDGDGATSPPELDQAARLFTEEGLIAFTREHLFRRGDWRERALLDYLTQPEYDLLINDILVEMGVLTATKKKTRPRSLCAGDDGQPITPAEAERRIRAYLAQPRRKVWTLDFDGLRVVL